MNEINDPCDHLYNMLGASKEFCCLIWNRKWASHYAVLSASAWKYVVTLFQAVSHI